MNKAEQREVKTTLSRLAAGLYTPDQAAGCLATVHRSALRKQTQREIEAILERESLFQYLKTNHTGALWQ